MGFIGDYDVWKLSNREDELKDDPDWGICPHCDEEMEIKYVKDTEFGEMCEGCREELAYEKEWNEELEYMKNEMDEITQHTIKVILDCDGKLKNAKDELKKTIENLVSVAISYGRYLEQADRLRS